MDRIRRLAEELRDEAYAAMSVEEIIAALNAPNIPVLREAWLTDRVLVAVLGMADALLVKLAIAASGDPVLQWAWEMMADRTSMGIDVALPECRAMIAALGDNPEFPLSPENAVKILAFAEHKISRAEQLGIGTVSGQDVRAAREVVI